MRFDRISTASPPAAAAATGAPAMGWGHCLASTPGHLSIFICFDMVFSTGRPVFKMPATCWATTAVLGSKTVAGLGDEAAIMPATRGQDSAVTALARTLQSAVP